MSSRPTVPPTASDVHAAIYARLVTETGSDVTDGGDDSFLRRSASAQRDSSLRFTGGGSLDEGQRYTMERLADLVGASRVFFATWSDTCYVGRCLVGVPPAEERAFRRRSLPALPPEAIDAREVIQISRVDELATRYPWLAAIADSDEVVLAVATWAARHPMCVIGIAGLDQLDEDIRVALDSFLLMVMGASIAERLLRERNQAELRRGEALETLGDELDDERRRVSHEIHDGVLQSVSSIAHFLETLSAAAESDESRKILERLRVEAQTSAITLRRIVTEFEPEQRQEDPMSRQLTDLGQRFADFFGLDVTVEVSPVIDELPPVRAVLRVLRQALDNIVTHADASKVVVTAHLGADRALTLTVDDDGTGMENDHPWKLGVGLRSMTQAVDAHGGHLHVGTSPISGTRLSATFSAYGSRQRRGEVRRDDVTYDSEDSAVEAIRAATLKLLDEGNPTIASVSELTGLSRRELLARHISAPSMVADAVRSRVDFIEERWAAFGSIEPGSPLEARLDELLERRFLMETWGRPIRQQTLVADPSFRLDDEVSSAFQPELARLDPSNREDTERLVQWLFRPRTIRAVISGSSIPSDVARSTIRSVVGGVLGLDAATD